MVVAAGIYGKPVRALIDSGATRCFVTPACVKTVGLKGQPMYVGLEMPTLRLENGKEKKGECDLDETRKRK